MAVTLGWRLGGAAEAGGGAARQVLVASLPGVGLIVLAVAYTW